jgi:hypothetical protein
VMADSTRIKNPNINSLLNRYFMTMLHAFQELKIIKIRTTA